MRIKKKFLQLTSYTYPHGTEGFLKSHLPLGYQTDKHGNYFLKVGDVPSTMFTCHLDTACSKQEKVTHKFTGDIIETNGKTILGADDKAGMVVLLYMIEKNIPGLYYFFLGEEVGCIGSGDLAHEWTDTEFSKHITKVVSFDRRGTTSVITHQCYGRCCSDEFANELAKKINLAGRNLNLKPDDTGVITDSAKFVYLVPECTNISVGYYNEHSTSERQNIKYLQDLCFSVSKVDWESLPVVRDKDYYSVIDEADENDWSVSYYSFFDIAGKTKKMYISKSVIEKEKEILKRYLQNNGYSDMNGIYWNGHTLTVYNSKNFPEEIGKRYELANLVPELESIELKHLSDKPKKSQFYLF